MLKESRLLRLPVSVMPTFVGVATLGNVYNGMGYTFVRHFSMLLLLIVMLLFTAKYIKSKTTFVKDYNSRIFSALLSGYPMGMMILGSYISESFFSIGKAVWFLGIIIHAFHIIAFSYKHIIKERDLDSFLPSTYVTYVGINVCAVVGANMNEDPLLKALVYFGIASYFIFLPFIIYRLIKHEIRLNVYHSMAVMLSPCSIALAGYFKVFEEKSQLLISVLYICILISLSFIILMLPKFFAIAFNPGFAGITFPMAIGVVASMRMGDYLLSIEYHTLAEIVRQISGVQLYLTTMTVSYVVLNFIIEALKLERKAI